MYHQRSRPFSTSLSITFLKPTTETSPSLLRNIETIHVILHGIITTEAVTSIVALNTELII